MKASVLGLNGVAMKEIELPKVFESDINMALIKRAVLSIQSARIQRKGTKKGAGRDYTAVYIGARGKPAQHRIINTERSRLPRLKNKRFLSGGNVALVSWAVKGPTAHPPKPEMDPVEYINKKEKRKATNSAIAATADLKLVKNRGHRIGDMKLPIVVEDRLEALDKTKKVVEALKALKVWADVERAKDSRTLRAGAGRQRGRRYQKSKSVLFVVKGSDKFFRAARNLEGVEVVKASTINAELLAPGTVPGRLTVYSEGAIKELGERK